MKILDFFNNEYDVEFPKLDDILPKVDFTGYRHRITNTDSICRIEIALPGFEKNDISLSIKDSVLEISYTTTEQNYWKRNFSKTFKLESGIASSKIEASMKNGILEITLPILDTTASSTVIPIK